MNGWQWFFVGCFSMAIVVLIEAVDLHLLWRRGKRWVRRDRWR